MSAFTGAAAAGDANWLASGFTVSVAAVAAVADSAVQTAQKTAVQGIGETLPRKRKKVHRRAPSVATATGDGDARARAGESQTRRVARTRLRRHQSLAV